MKCISLDEKVIAFKNLRRIAKSYLDSRLNTELIEEVGIDSKYLDEDSTELIALWILTRDIMDGQNAYKFKKDIQKALKDVNFEKEKAIQEMLMKSLFSIYFYEVADYDPLMAEEMQGWPFDKIYDITKSVTNHIEYGSGVISKKGILVRKFDNLTPDDSGEEPLHVGGKEHSGIYISWKSIGFDEGLLWVFEKITETTTERIHDMNWPNETEEKEKVLLRIALGS